MKQGITKAEVARQLGISRAYVTMLVNGKRKPTKDIVNKLDTLGLTFNQGVVGSSPSRPILILARGEDFPSLSYT